MTISFIELHPGPLGVIGFIAVVVVIIVLVIIVALLGHADVVDHCAKDMGLGISEEVEYAGYD